MRMKRYEQYKPTGISWLPEIPAHWDTMRIRGLFEESIEKTVNDSGTLLSLSQYTGVSLKSEAGKTGMFEAESTTGYKIVHPGQFVMNIMLAWNGSYAVSDLEGIISPAYCVFDFRIPCVKRYFDYLLRTKIYSGAFRTQSRGIIDSRLRLYPNKLYSFKAIVPPIEEQKKIVAYLDKKITLIESCKCQRERELQTLNELKQAEIASVVTRGLNPNVPMKDSGIPWIGQIPAHWDLKYLFQIAREHYISNKEVHHQNLLSLSYGKIVRKDINTTDGLLPASFDTYQIIEPGNIVFRFTDLQNDHKSLRVGLTKETGIITSAYVVVEVDQEYILPEYFYYTLHSFDIKKLFYSMGGGLRQSLNYNGIRKLNIPIPPIEEQKSIVSFIEEKTNRIETMIRSLESEIEHLSEYKQRLISDVVTGQINVQNEQV